MTPSGRMGRWMEQRRGGDVSWAHPGALQGPSSSSLRSPIWEVGDVGPEESLIPLQVGGEPRPNLGLAWGIRDPSWRELSSGRSVVVS